MAWNTIDPIKYLIFHGTIAFIALASLSKVLAQLVVIFVLVVAAAAEVDIATAEVDVAAGHVSSSCIMRCSSDHRLKVIVNFYFVAKLKSYVDVVTIQSVIG